MTMTTPTLAPVPSPTRGSGAIRCTEPTCTGHREKCLFGRRHLWQTWIKQGRIMRTADTYWCHQCDGICTGNEV